MTKDDRVNPDPLYPKNLGYQFRGYTLGESSIPTFMYQSGTIEIEDRSVALTANGKVTLKRLLQFSSPVHQSVLFRALTGDINLESERVFKSGKLRLTILQAETLLRPLQNDPKSSELLLRMEIPQGQSNLELIYEPLQP